MCRLELGRIHMVCARHRHVLETFEIALCKTSRDGDCLLQQNPNYYTLNSNPVNHQCAADFVSGQWTLWFSSASGGDPVASRLHVFHKSNFSSVYTTFVQIVCVCDEYGQSK